MNDGPLSAAYADDVDTESVVDVRYSTRVTKEPNIQGTICRRVFGGYIVSVQGGDRGFLPASQVGLIQNFDPEAMIDQTWTFKVLGRSTLSGERVLSRRALLEEERTKLYAEQVQNLKVGDIVTGTIKSMPDFGVFVSLGKGPVYPEGLLHISDISWDRRSEGLFNDLGDIGDPITVQILSIEQGEVPRISLGLKHLTQNPMDIATCKRVVGENISGRVVSVMDYGVFIELEPGVEGLLHASETPGETFEIGQTVECHINKVIPKRHGKNGRIGLGSGTCGPGGTSRWSQIVAQYKEGDIVQGPIVAVKDYGVFVRLQSDIDGLIHKENLSRPIEEYVKGQIIETRVLRIEDGRKRIALALQDTVNTAEVDTSEDA